MAKKMFITDFDGTLLTDNKNIHPRDIDTLDQLRRNHVYTAIATGRSIYSFEKALGNIYRNTDLKTLPIDFVIFSTGAGLLEFKSREVIYKRSIPGSKIGKIIDFLDAVRINYMIHKAIPDTQYFLYRDFGQECPDFHHRINMYKEFGRPLNQNDHPQTPATEVLAVLPGGRGHEFATKIQKAFSDLSVIHATSPLDRQSAWVEIFHKDVSKSRTAAYLSRRLGIDPGNVVSVGNDYNDQDLLEWSGKGWVVENAPACLKKQFKTVPSNNRCGVTRAARECGWLDNDGLFNRPD